MSQHDFDIANQTAPNTRVDINNALKALASVSSGASAPTTTYANMIYYNTGNNILYKRNEADSAWITVGTFDETAGTFTPSGLVFASQAEAEAGTNNTKVMTPLRVDQAIEANYGPKFTSSLFTPSRDLRLTIPHTLGRAPWMVQARMQCITAEREYSVGDQIYLSPGAIDYSSGHGVNISADSTNIYFGTYYIVVRNKNTGTLGAGTWNEINYANWQIRLYAF